MYYYLSFLRPPPKTVSLAEGTIVFTPQIANDLRTVLKEDGPTDIHCVWQQIDPASGPIQTTRPAKLTTYNPPSNTYKPISIALPAQAKPSQTWRLGLFSPPAQNVQGSLDTLSQHVCGVWSDGISILAPHRAAGKPDKHASGVKQTRVFREWCIDGGEGLGISNGRGARRHVTERETAVPKAPEVLRIVEQTSFDLDKKIWDSGLALSAWLHHHLERHSQKTIPAHPLINAYIDRLLASASATTQVGVVSRSIRVIELGAGTGLVSFALASALRRYDERLRAERQSLQEGSKVSSFEIYATDLESALPLIDENAILNSQLWDRPDVENNSSVSEPALAESQSSTGDVVAPKISIHSKVLDWEQDLPSWVYTTEDGKSSDIDLVIAADVTYNTDSFPALINTLSSLLKPKPSTQTGASTSPLLLLAYKERDISERDLWQMAEEQGIWLEKVDVIRGHESAKGKDAAGATEIWIGGAGKPPGK